MLLCAACSGTAFHWPWEVGAATGSGVGHPGAPDHPAGPPGLADDLNRFLNPVIWLCMVAGFIGLALSWFVEVIPRKVCGAAIGTAFALILGKSYILAYAHWFFLAITVCVVAACAPWIIATFRAIEHKSINPSKSSKHKEPKSDKLPSLPGVDRHHRVSVPSDAAGTGGSVGAGAGPIGV